MNPQEAIAALIAYALSGKKWPLESEKPILTAINTWAALREQDRDTVKKIAGWKDNRKGYRCDALPERITDAWAHYLWGQAPRITPAADGDAALLEALLGEDDLSPELSFTTELERGAGLGVSEGEIWARCYVDELVATKPLLDWVSRRNVLPLYRGIRLVAAAVITELGDGGNKGTMFRHFEIHAPGAVANRLFAGKGDELGREVPLESHELTADLEPDWPHGLPGMLVTRIPNRIRGNRNLGVSDYKGILDDLLDLNEAKSIGAHNMRLTARKRAVLSRAALSGIAGTRSDLDLTPEEQPTYGQPPQARFDPEEEVFIEDPLDAELGRDSKDPYRIMEYSFDAASLIEWKKDLVESAINRVGLVGQYVGADDSEGYAISGTALRLRLIPTDATGRAKARYWVPGARSIVQTLQLLDAASSDVQGFGRSWANAGDAPTIERRPGLPEDELEEITGHSQAVTAGIESVFTAVKERHPDWDDNEVNAEVDRIREDRSAAAPTMPGFGA